MIRFIAATPAIILLTYVLIPYRLFSFPMQRPVFWAVVMVLYPLLSVLPQEMIFRSFFFRRYSELFGNPRSMMAVNALCFAFAHVMFHNWVSPFLCLIGGGFFAWSYRQHRSLKWALVEHAAYGCMIFTVGIGAFFLVHGLQR